MQCRRRKPQSGFCFMGAWESSSGCGCGVGESWKPSEKTWQRSRRPGRCLVKWRRKLCQMVKLATVKDFSVNFKARCSSIFLTLYLRKMDLSEVNKTRWVCGTQMPLAVTKSIYWKNCEALYFYPSLPPLLFRSGRS